MEENLNKGDSPIKSQDPANKKTRKDLRILGLNLLILIAYSILSRLTAGGGILDAVFIGAHLLCCILIGAVERSWAWLLSGLLVLVIGFATCVEVLWR